MLLLVLGVGYGAFLVLVPYGPAAETFVDIPAGVGTAGIATRLERAGVIRSREAFLAMRRVEGGTLRAGEYRFEGAATLGEVYARVARGDVYTRALVIPEGFNIFDVARAVEAAGLGSAADFLAAERRETRLIADMSPHATSLEGYLFPDTYRFSRHATPAAMLAAMVKRFRQVAAGLGLPTGPGLPTGLGLPAGAGTARTARTVTLASLVEKEVRVDAERPLVAGVFVNRMAVGMPLGTDPAVVYAALLAGTWRGTIHRSDLDADSPYNTYRHAGLPPGPIANPGVAALRAAMQPAHTEYLYFVADAQGHSRFSVDLREHARQVQDYRAAGGR